MKGERLLQHANRIFEERRAEYGDAQMLFHKVAKRWSLVLGHEVTPQQVVLCLMDLKQERLCNDPSHIDSIADKAGYAAVLAELSPDQRGFFDGR